MISTVLALVLSLPPGGGTPTSLPPRSATWSQAQSVFPSAWMLPPSAWAPTDPTARNQTLPFALRALLARRFESALDAPAWTRTFGDFVAESRRRGPPILTLDRLLVELEATNEPAHAAFARLARELLLDKGLYSTNWDGESDLPDDGLYFGATIQRNEITASLWSSHSGAESLHQAAALVFADLEAIKSAVNDYPAMLADRGTSYEFIGPTADTFVTGQDAARGPFAALRIHFRSSLPFPFSHYDCDLGILDVLDSERCLTTYIYSPSRDFHWFAGQDFHYPVYASDGTWQGTLLVRLCGFDLRGVPEDDDDRIGGTRVALGHLKRRAESAFRRYGGAPRTESGSLPRFEILAERSRQR